MPPLGFQNFEARRTRVSASEVAALMPEGHPYMTALDVYERLRNPDAPTKPASLAMRAGSHLEAGILALAAEQYGWKVRANHKTHIAKHAPLCATPDALIVNADTLVEIKYSARAEAWATLPHAVYWQVQAQLACNARMRSCVVVVLVGTRLIRYDVARNTLAIHRLRAASRRLLAAVAAGVPPSVNPYIAPVLGEVAGDIPPSLIRSSRNV
jgi:hypothetical protein